MTKKNKILKLQEKEDRISALPDTLIQHIIFFLPSTNEAIQTTILSKSFHNQWTRVPVLNFYSSGMSVEKFSTFIDNALLLYDSSKIQKFHIQSDCKNGVGDPNYWIAKIHFAISKEVEELVLQFGLGYNHKQCKLPEFIFKHASLVKLQTYYCNFDSMPNGTLSWRHLKALNIEYCTLPHRAIENILYESPSLESLQLSYNNPCESKVIVSTSLKKLMLKDVWICLLEISCPNLKELKLLGHFLTWTPPNKLMNWPSLNCTTLDVENYEVEIIQQLHHVKELKFGSRFIETLSDKKFGARLSSLLFNNKSLTLDNPNFEKHYDGITCALHSLYLLEILVIKLPIYKSQMTTDLRDLNIVSNENYWDSNRTTFNCLASHLKIIEINDLSESDDNWNLVLNFVEFLLKNAIVLEKLVVILKDVRNDFMIEVSQQLSNFPKRSKHAMVELLCSN